MKRLMLFLAILLSALAVELPALADDDLSPAAGAATRSDSSLDFERPNIVIIVADDAGYSDWGCYGGEINTPHLDRLAEGGLRFAKFYNNGSDGPTRASLLTGQYPQRVGMGGPAEPLSETPFAGYLGYLSPDNNVTLAEALRSAGYHTLMAGKWHLGGERTRGAREPDPREKRKWPQARGFDRFFGLIHRNTGYFEPTLNRFWKLGSDDYRIPDGADFYATDAITDFAVDWIEEAAAQDDRPFFLYLAYTAPHAPLEARPDDIRKYEDAYRASWAELQRRRYEKAVSLGVIPRDWRQASLIDSDRVKNDDSVNAAMAVYAAMIDRLDQGVGRVVDALRQLGQLDNTLILFLSDNGAAAEPTDSRQALSNTPFRGGAGTLHEGGIASPLIASWPAVIRNEGEIAHYAAHVIDVMPTCLDVAGSTYPAQRAKQSLNSLDGVSLVPLLHGERLQGSRTLFWDLDGQQAVLEGKWKFLRDADGLKRLYDLETDGTETTNLALDHPEVVSKLLAAHQAWAEQANVLPNEAVRKAQWNRQDQRLAAAQAAQELLKLDERERGRLPSEEMAALFARQEARSVSADGIEMSAPYYLYRPRHLVPGEHYPLVVWLPGNGPIESRYEDLGFLNWIDQFLSAGGVGMENHQFFMLVPAGVVFAAEYGADLGQHAAAPSPIDRDKYALAKDMIDHALQNEPIDPNAVSAIGISAGGRTALELAARQPATFAAVVPLASSGIDASQAAPLVDVPIWAFNNKFDDATSIDGVRSMVAAINKAGGTAHLTEFYREGHNAWDPAIDEFDVRGWMVAQRRGRTADPPADHVAASKRLAIFATDFCRANFPQLLRNVLRAIGTVGVGVVVLMMFRQERKRWKRACDAPNANLPANAEPAVPEN